MKTVSKFDPFYIAVSIIKIFFPLFFLFFVFFASNGESFEFTQDGVLRFSLIVFVVVALNYLVFHRLIQVSVTESDITFKNLLTINIRQIKFDNVEEILYDSVTSTSDPYYWRLQWSDTRRKYIGLKMKNGKVFWFNDYKYDNFDEIDEAIQEIMKKKSA